MIQASADEMLHLHARVELHEIALKDYWKLEGSWGWTSDNGWFGTSGGEVRPTCAAQDMLIRALFTQAQREDGTHVLCDAWLDADVRETLLAALARHASSASVAAGLQRRFARIDPVTHGFRDARSDDSAQTLGDATAVM